MPGDVAAGGALTIPPRPDAREPFDIAEPNRTSQRSIGMGMRLAAIGVATLCLSTSLLTACSSHTAPLLIVSPPTTPLSTPTPPLPTPTASAIPSPSPTTTGLTAASLRPESVTFVSAEDGWVLGLSMCGHATCLRLAKTLDAGRTWAWVSTESLSTLSVSTQWHVRFADSDDGWISGPRLYSTHDGGRIWTRVALAALEGPNSSVGALETADGRVYAEVVEGTEPNTLGPVVLFGSRTNSDAWFAVPSVTTGPDGFAGNISVAQGVFWISLHPAIVTPQGSQALSTLYRSLDGVNWRAEPQPCPSDSVATIGAATANRVFVVCAAGLAAGSEGKSAYRSDDGGASYERVADPPLGGDFEEVSAAPSSVSVAASSGATEIYTSFDGGQTWVTTLTIGDAGLGLSDLGFTTAAQGVAIHGRVDYPDSLQLLMTRDGGHQWTVVDVSPR